MQLLRGVLSFGATNDEMVHLWITFCRSVLEQSSVVWHGSLTQENVDDLERTQKTFCKLVLKQKYKDYEHSLLHLNLDSLTQRRDTLCLKFAKAGIKYDKLKDLLPEQEKRENITTRNQNKYKVNFALTGRLKKASIISMQNMLNNDVANEESRKRSCG